MEHDLEGMNLSVREHRVKTMRRGLTFNCSLLVKFWAQHPESKKEDCDGQYDPDTEANSPYCGKVVFSSDWKYNEENRYCERTSKLETLFREYKFVDSVKSYT